MEAKFVQMKNAGMQQDNSVSKVSNDFAFENCNIRITNNGENTQLSVTNEKTPKELPFYTEFLSTKRTPIWVKFYLSSEEPDGMGYYHYTAETEKPITNIAMPFIMVDDPYTGYEEELPLNTATTETEYLSYSKAVTLVSTSVSESADLQILYKYGDSVPESYIPAGTSVPGGVIEGKYCGLCKCRDYLVIFTSTHIYRIQYDTIVSVGPVIKLVTLYTDLNNNWNINTEKPIDTLYYYETEEVQKVYWTDGKNQPRFINITPKSVYAEGDPNQFNFSPELKAIPTVTVTKDYNYSGIFPQGTIQYFFTYYNKFGAETSIVCNTSIQYLSYKERGAKPDENVYCGMVLTVENIPSDFEYLRIYAAQRTSLNGPVSLRIVTDINIKETSGTVTYIDLGKGETIDSNLLYYIGGSDFIAETLTCKDDTVFFGNVTLSETSLSAEIKTFFEDIMVTTESGIKTSPIIYFGDGKLIDAPLFEGYYAHTQQINEPLKVFGTFKKGEIYRFALQFMTKTGKWTIPVWIGDLECSESPYYIESDKKYCVPAVRVDFSELPVEKREELWDLLDNKYIAYRLLRAETDNSTRQILAQGIVNSTLFNYQERYNNEPYAIPSWNFRIRGSEAPYHHYESIGCQYRPYAELQGITEEKIPAYNIELEEIYEHFKYFTLLLGVDPGHEAVATLIYFSLPEGANAESNIQNLILQQAKFQPYVAGTTPDWDNNGYYIAETVYYNTAKWGKTMKKIYSGLEDAHTDMMDTLYGQGVVDSKLPIDISSLPTKNECKKIMTTKFGTAVWVSVVSAIVTAAAIAVSVVSFGTAAAPAGALAATGIGALIAALGTGAAASIGAVAVSMGILGGTAVTYSAIKAQRASTWDSADDLMAKKGWIYAGKRKEVINFLQNNFNNSSSIQNDIKEAFQGGAFWVTGGQLARVASYSENNAEEKSDQFYVDNSIVTFNSPDFENVQDILKNNSSLAFRIVGVAPIRANYMDYDFVVGPGHSDTAKAVKGYKEHTELVNPVTNEFTNGFLYQDTDFIGNTIHPAVDGTGIIGYETYLWNRRFASAAGNHIDQIVSKVTGDSLFGVIEKKIFANQLYSCYTQYFDTPWVPAYGIYAPQIYTGDGNANTLTTEGYDFNIYNGRYDSVITFSNGYPIVTQNNTDPETGIIIPNTTPGDDYYACDEMLVQDPVSIGFESGPHAIIRFASKDNVTPVLPILGNEIRSSFFNQYSNTDGMSEMYDITKQYRIPWDKTGSSINDLIVENATYLYLDRDYSVFTLDFSEDAAFNNKLADELQYDLSHDNLITTTNGYTYHEFLFFLDSTASSTGYRIIKALIEKYNTLYPNAGFDPSSGTQVSGVRAALSRIRVIIHFVYKDGTETIHYNGILTAKNVDNVSYISLTYSGANDNTDPYTKQPYYIQYPIDETLSNWSGILTGQLTYLGESYFHSAVCPMMSLRIPSQWAILEKNSSVCYPVTGGTVFMEENIGFEDFSNSYIFIGEIYKKVFDYSTLYGGTSESALQRLKWIVCSETAAMDLNDTYYWYGDGIWDNTWGDTYYQRWDCLKSFPTTDDTQNGIVEILSCMLETHVNIDGRCDINRGTGNIVNARPDNWNIINKSYSQEDNLFQYSILDDKFSLTKYKNQIAWSSVKLPASNIDTWANINLLSSIFVDGQYGAITKLLKINNSVTFFQDKAIGIVNYNNRTQISTQDGQPLEIINSGKVNGYTYLDTNSGTTAKETIAQTGIGVFYLDVLNKAAKLLNTEGSADLGVSYGMSGWFNSFVDKDCSNSAFTDYDKLTGDIYLHVGGTVIAYNEKLKAFSSFYEPYLDLKIVNFEDTSLGIVLGESGEGGINQMYAGDKYFPYNMNYQVNPNPLTDKIFTNIEYIADFLTDDYTKPYGDIESFVEGDPFKTLEIANEYQTAVVDLSNNRMPDFLSPDKNRKFRIRRAQIPNAYKESDPYCLDRIRSPWCYINLSSGDQSELVDNKMVFHSLTVKYFE